LGVPGSSPAAVIAGALMLRGLNPGPELFQSDGSLVFSFGWSLLFAGIVTFILGTLFAPLLVRIIKIPLRLLAPLIMLLAIIGAYAIRNNIFDVYIMLALGVFVFLIRRLGFHPGPIGLGLILGPIIEPSLVQAMYISDATSVWNVFFTGTINIILITLSVLSIVVVVWSRQRDRMLARNGAATGISHAKPDGPE
ncbi:MAG: C4-dicarboxylate ABC transporter permease, partial [Rhodospirillaceae bacterium]|nr:C4-dicarboxylate ABC transporter permease [Rhodospirillaceae bacterium]